jgi:TPR repeat protein
MLSLLFYELLGGPRQSVEATGRYTPIAVLSAEGNSVLRRGLTDELASATEMCALLEEESFGKGGEYVLAAKVEPFSSVEFTGEPTPPAPAAPPQTYVPPVPPEPSAAPSTIVPPPLPSHAEKRKTSVAGLLLVLGLIVLLFAGFALGYAVYRYFVSQQFAESKGKHARPSISAAPRQQPTASPAPTQEERFAESKGKHATPSILLTPRQEPTASPAPTQEERMTPSATPEERANASATPEEKLAPSPTPVAIDDFQEKLAAAQELNKTGDWQGAMKAYLELIDRYPERSIALKRLDNLLAGLYGMEGKPDAASYAEAKPYFVRAAEKGVVPAMMMISQFSLESDPAESLKWYEIAAAKGSAPAMVGAGLLYSNRHQPGDDRKALEYFLQGANAGDRRGKYLTGECYYYGKGVPVDIPKAVAFLQESAALGEPRAMDLLGTYFRKLRQFERARKSYEDAAAAGYTLSLSNLGVLYMNGEGVKRSPEVAANLFKQGADKGDATGMFYYAGCLQEGLGVPRDPKAAVEWFRRSAHAGSPRAIEWFRLNGIPYK